MKQQEYNSDSGEKEPQLPLPASTARRAILAAPFVSAFVAAGASPAGGGELAIEGTSIRGTAGGVLVDPSTDASTAGLLAAPNSLSRTTLNSTFVGQGDLLLNVKDFGAKGDGLANDTAAFATALADAKTQGGVVYAPRGMYLISSTLILDSNVTLAGETRSATIIKAANGSNIDLVKSRNYDTHVGRNTTGGVQQVMIRDLTLDGNKANNPIGGAGIKHYGAMVNFLNIVVRNCKKEGILSEWSNAGLLTDGCEGYMESVVAHNNDSDGVVWSGPHDSHWLNCVSFQNTGAGFWIKMGAAIHVATQCHSWGTKQTYAWKLDSKAFLTACQGEGASIAQLLVGSNDCQILGGEYFGFGASAKGIQIGDAAHPNITGTRIDTRIRTCPAGALDFTYSGGNGRVVANIWGTGIGVVGSVPHNEQVLVQIDGGATGFTGSRWPNEAQFWGGMHAIGVFGENHKFNINGAAGKVELLNGTDLILFKDNYATEMGRFKALYGSLHTGAYTTETRPNPALVGAGGQIFDTTLGKPLWSTGSAWKDASGTYA